MDFKKIRVDCMTQEYAKQITKWRYRGRYSSYDLPCYDECVQKKYGITREDTKDNYLVYLLDDEVVFYFNGKPMDNNRIYIGVGLKPKYCGKGYGSYFLKNSMRIVKEKYPNSVFFLEVRSWNKRAIKSYKKIGFKITNIVMSKDRLGNDTEFVEMKM